MPSLRFRLSQPVFEEPDWAALRAELRISVNLSPAVLAEAKAAAARPLPDAEDRRDWPFFTLDPAGSRDLDQAMYLERTSSGYLVHYAIADVGHFVSAGDALDVRAHEQGQTFYGPDEKVPLYPFAISEGAGSLLPQQDRPVVLWTIALDGVGEIASVDVRRALIRSQRQLSYDDVGLGNDGSLEVLQDVGSLRQKLARERDAVDLPSPEQVVEEGPGGPYLRYRATTPLEMCNSQISLLTGIAAATLMMKAKVGILRTLPEAPPEAVSSLRLSAKALGVIWPSDASYGDVVSGIDPNSPQSLAFLNLAARLLRGANYVSFNGSLPEQVMHSGVGAPYAHCTAPLRRLADRYVSETCLAICSGAPVPKWVLDGLDRLPREMSASDQRAHALSKAIIDAAEAHVMASRIGQDFDAVVIENYRGDRQGTAFVQVNDPAVRADCDTGTARVDSGWCIRVRCVDADTQKRKVRFALVHADPNGR